MSYPDDWNLKGTADQDNALVLNPAYEGNASLNIGNSANKNMVIYPGSETEAPQEAQIITKYHQDQSGDSARTHPAFIFYFQDVDNYYAWEPIYGGDQGAEKTGLWEYVNGNRNKLTSISDSYSTGWAEARATVWEDSGSTFFRFEWDKDDDGSYEYTYEHTVGNPEFTGGGVGIGSGGLRDDARGGYFDQTEILY